MDAILNVGLDIIRAIQTIHGPLLDTFFRTITSLGGGEVYILLLPLFFWCIDTSLGAHVGLVFLVSSYFSNGLKDLFKQPRPFVLDPSVKIGNADGYGLPSFHALEATVMWGMLAVWLKKPWFWVVAIMMMIFIGFSRVYLGVHFPTDVLAAYAVGATFLWIYATGGNTLERWLKGLPFKWQIILSIAAPMVLAISHPTDDVILITSALSGFCLGLSLLNRYLSFSAAGPVSQRVARFVVGDAVILALYMVPRAFSFVGLDSFHSPLRYAHYGILGLWITFGGPYMFRKLKLAGPASAPQEAEEAAAA